MAKKGFLLGILVIVLVFGMTVVSCDNGSTNDNGSTSNSDNKGGVTSWPGNLSGTKWEVEWFGTMEFKTDNTFYFSFINETCALVSAVENGKIVVKYKGENETLCASYFINGNTLTLSSPSSKLLDSKTIWTKVN